MTVTPPVHLSMAGCPLPQVRGVAVDIALPVESAVWMVADAVAALPTAVLFLHRDADFSLDEVGMVTTPGGAAVELQFEDELPVTLWVDGNGRAVAFHVNLVPWLHPDDDEEAQIAALLPETVATGWSTPVTVPMLSPTAVMGDAVAVEKADSDAVALVQWPQWGGTLHLSVFTHGGHRRQLCGVWVAPSTEPTENT